MPDPDSGPGPYSPEKFWRYNFGGDPATRWMPRYDFINNRNSCTLFEALLVEQGLAHEYAMAVALILQVKMHWQAALSAGLHVTANQRCLALKQVIADNQDTNT